MIDFESGDSDLWERVWLPRRPLATDNFTEGAFRMDRGAALQRRFIEINPRALANLFVVDIDHGDAALRALSAQGSHPMPTAIVENTANGHAHAVWALREPVTRTEYGTRKAVAYAAAVVEGLRRAVDGDAGYSMWMMKNPAHADWTAHWLSDELRSLGDLAEGLGRRMPPRRWRGTGGFRANPQGLGRNCSIFETARTWAYAEARQIRLRHEHPTAGDSEALLAAITEHVGDLNRGFAEPLPLGETLAIAGSIHRWIVTKFYGWTDSRTVNEATFAAIQSARGRRPRTDVRRWRDGLETEVL